MLVLDEPRQFVLIQVANLGQADAMLARDDTAERLRQLHDPRDHAIGLVQHLVIMRMHRDVGVYIAVAGVHVQGDEQAIVADFGMGGLQRIAQGFQG